MVTAALQKLKTLDLPQLANNEQCKYVLFCAGASLTVWGGLRAGDLALDDNISQIVAIILSSSIQAARSVVKPNQQIAFCAVVPIACFSIVFTALEGPVKIKALCLLLLTLTQMAASHFVKPLVTVASSESPKLKQTPASSPRQPTAQVLAGAAAALESGDTSSTTSGGNTLRRRSAPSTPKMEAGTARKNGGDQRTPPESPTTARRALAFGNQSPQAVATRATPDVDF